MPRVQNFDTDRGRLPEGMTRIGYDSETGVYIFRAADGTLWESAPGIQYGELTPVGASSKADLDFHKRNPQFFSSPPPRASTNSSAGDGPYNLDNLPIRSAAVPRSATQRRSVPQRRSATQRRSPAERRYTAPSRPADGPTRASSWATLRQRVRSVKTTLTGSVNKTLEEVKSAFSKT
ncbi:peptidoglycan-binding domain-containing [Fusarium sporotrichioides]|uniref:Peptidoglycan-binding domain-containing n=1 Tax=Fusarium sporotrichioides TaxID=5514 RepID=A0A395SR23_FUSSP|nr:peptidoglycan-binding domain-containing [Fusarium sporotrichioides]